MNDFLDKVHPLLKEWFIKKVGVPSEPQLGAWPHIYDKKSVLISSPTGSGKTLAAFLPAINILLSEALEGFLPNETRVVYVSPLKALSNDVQKNLIEPLLQITELAAEKNTTMVPITVGLRTGDTPQNIRRAMGKKPPHILVTTPESLYILLTAKKSRDNLRAVHTVIIDEIHALAKDKRGVHLALSLERLEALCPTPLVRIGLSATQKPMELIGQFLTGSIRKPPVIIDIGQKQERALSIEVPKESLSAIATNEMWEEIYERLALLAQEHRSTLIFANTRRLAERVAHNLSLRLGADCVRAHHGSLSRSIRLEAETKLKEGNLKALVATASLELGIDIGKLDLVCQIGSPRSIAVGLQRIGRSGHWHKGVSKAHFFPTTRDELLECAALLKSIDEGILDALILKKNSLDIMAQQVVAMCALDSYEEEELFGLIKGAYPFKELSKKSFDDVIAMLSLGISGERGRYGSLLFHDKVNKRVTGKKNSLLSALMNGGAIVDNGLFTVVAEPQNVTVGTLDEDFAIESSKGEIVLLGTTSWKIKRIEANAGRVIVESAHGLPPNVPFWRGEAPGRTNELSLMVSELREQIGDRLLGVVLENYENDAQFLSIARWLKKYCHLDDHGAIQLIKYIADGRSVLSTIPSQRRIVAERFFDEAGGMQLVIHSPFGSRINKAWGLALRKKFCRSFNFELQASATDNGLNISLLEQHSFPLAEVFSFLNPKTVKEVLVQAVLQSPLFATRFRAAAVRSLALLKVRNGKKLSPHIVRILSDDLLASVFPEQAACQDNLPAHADVVLPDHPLIIEAMTDLLTEALDAEGLRLLLEKIVRNEIECIAIDTITPSAFAHEILSANPYAFLDDAPLEERRTRAVNMRGLLPETMLNDIGRLDEEVIRDVSIQAWPDIRSVDELHDAIQMLSLVPKLRLEDTPSLDLFLEQLISQKRVARASINGELFYLSAEKKEAFLAIHPHAKIHDALAPVEQAKIEQHEAILDMIRHWMYALGPTSSAEISQLLMLPPSQVEAALFKLESSGRILRGNFTATSQLEWCERRILARIHRLTLEKLRKDITEIPVSRFIQWLSSWQHATKASRLNGKSGLLEIIKQLQGLELPAKAWEMHIFRTRLHNYHPGLLDELGLKGIIGWARVSEHPALRLGSKKKVIARSSSPITFFVREDRILKPRNYANNQIQGISVAAQNICELLRKKGALFFHEILRDLKNHLPYELEAGLAELMAAGLLTADDFDNMRVLLSKRRRAHGLRSCTGRFSLFNFPEDEEEESLLENWAWLLLNRYGVVFRDLLKREKNAPPWKNLIRVFRRLEDRGQIRGGRFIAGFFGEQFAVPSAVDSMRAKSKEIAEEEPLNLASVDPLEMVRMVLTVGESFNQKRGSSDQDDKLVTKLPYNF